MSISLINRFAALLLLVYPTSMLAVKGGMNGVFLLMLALALMEKLQRKEQIPKQGWNREWNIYVVSMFALTVAIVLSQAYHLHFTAKPYDAASRYWLALPVFLFLQRLNLRSLTAVQYAFPVAAITGFLLAKSETFGRVGISTLDLIHFGDFELIMGVLSLGSIDWFGNDKWPAKILKVAGGVAGFLASIASGTRGGWLALPVLVILVMYFRWPERLFRNLLILLVASLICIPLLYKTSSVFQSRVGQAYADLTAFDQGERDTPVGIRLQLYRAAVLLFVDHPVFGVGPDQYAQEMEPLQRQGKITEVAAGFGKGEVHNDILCKTAGMGSFGLAAMLLVYLGPAWLFLKATKSSSSISRRAGMLGISYVAAVAVFGLTAEILNLTMAVAFYSFTVAVLLAVSYRAQAEHS